MNKKIIFILVALVICGLNVFSETKVLKYTVTVPSKSNPNLTSAVVSSHTTEICCIYQYGMHYSVDKDGNVKLVDDYSFSQAVSDFQVGKTNYARIKGTDYSSCSIQFKYDRENVSSAETVKANDKGVQSVTVMKNTMIKALKKSKLYKKYKKQKKSFSGRVYPDNKLSLRVGGTGVSVSETFLITEE